MTLLDGLLAHWKLDEESGDRLDSSGNERTLTALGPLLAVPGKLGLAVSMDDPDSGLQGFPEVADLVQDGCAVAGWFRPRTGVPYGTIVYINGATYGGIFALSIGDGRVPQWVIGGGIDFLGGTVVGDPLAADEWHLLIGSWEKGVGLTLQIDGAAPLFYAYAGGTLVPADQPLYVYPNADVDSLSIWGRNLVPAEFAQLWNNGAGLDHPFTPTAPQTGAGIPGPVLARLRARNRQLRVEEEATLRAASARRSLPLLR